MVTDRPDDTLPSVSVSQCAHLALRFIDYILHQAATPFTVLGETTDHALFSATFATCYVGTEHEI